MAKIAIGWFEDSATGWQSRDLPAFWETPGALSDRLG